MDLLVVAARTFTAWRDDHLQVPREQAFSAIAGFARAVADHILGAPEPR